jgi:hypothetical protein
MSYFLFIIWRDGTAVAAVVVAGIPCPKLFLVRFSSEFFEERISLNT